MSGDVVNLRRFRKSKARDDKERQAAENRRLFGRGKAEKTLVEAEKRREKSRLDGHERDKP